MTEALPPADWYPDPTGARAQRYFDGSEWTDHYTTLLSLDQRSAILAEAIASHYPWARVESRSPTQAVLFLGGGVSAAAARGVRLAHHLHLWPLRHHLADRGRDVA